MQCGNQSAPFHTTVMNHHHCISIQNTNHHLDSWDFHKFSLGFECQRDNWCDTYYNKQETIDVQIYIFKLQHPQTCDRYVSSYQVSSTTHLIYCYTISPPPSTIYHSPPTSGTFFYCSTHTLSRLLVVSDEYWWGLGADLHTKVKTNTLHINLPQSDMN